MPHQNLTADQAIALANCCHDAMNAYRAMAIALREERDRLNAPTQHADWRQHARIAELYDYRAEQASELAEIIAQATDVAIVP
jgi:hypothetical protein